jgi:TELO2-interacting protein 2
MLSHLERQPRNKERRIAWLKSVDSLLNGVGLVLLAHFRRIFPLFFQWMHADDDDTIILVSIFTYRKGLKLHQITSLKFVEDFLKAAL